MNALDYPERRSHGDAFLHIRTDPARADTVDATMVGGRVDAGSIRFVAGLRDALTPSTSTNGHALVVAEGDRDHRFRSPGLDDRRFDRVVAFMAARLGDDIEIAELASVACLSAFHFTRMFRLRTGLPPYRYLSAMRLEEAKTLLSTTDRSLCDIALASGFSNQTNFTRAFRRYTGRTPGEFRRACRGRADPGVASSRPA